jgi:LEA14-like dessication related protein
MKILIPILLVLLGFLSSCKDVKDPEFRRVDNFGIRNLSIQEARVGFDVTYFNPNNFGVNVKEAEADVYIDSLYIGKFVQDKTIDVPRGAEFSIPFTGSVPLRTVLGMNLDNLSSRQVLLRAEGSARVGKGGIYLTKPINYRGMHSLDEIR